MTEASSEQIVEAVIVVPVSSVDAALGVLYEHSPGGFRDGVDVEASDLAVMADGFPDMSSEPDTDTHEYGVYTNAAAAQELRAALDVSGVEVLEYRVEPVPADWNERWQAFHQAIQVGGLWVGPPWQEASAPMGVPRVVIEPGQGFGTGAHPTTRLVLGFLASQPRASIVDVGTGSGVLAIAAHRLGFGPIVAFDNDPDAVANARDNFARNECAQAIDARVIDAIRDPLPQAAIALANLTLEPLRAIAPRLKCGRVLASGILRSQAESAEAIFAEAGYVTRERADRDGWVAFVFESIDPDLAVGSRFV